MQKGHIPKREASWFRSVAYVLNRFLLWRPFLTAHLPDTNLTFRVKTEDIIGRHLYKYRVHEPELTALVLTQLKFAPGDVILDIGANIGWYSVLLNKIVPEGADIFSFEPDPLNFKLLGDNLQLNDADRVRPFQLALAEEPGVMRLYQHNNNNLGRHSLLPLQEGKSVEVQTTTLDGFWDEQQLGSRIPRFMKIDIEGYELFALRGAENVLARCPTVVCEFSPGSMRSCNLNPSDLTDLFIGHGFHASRITSAGLKPISVDAIRQIEQTTDLFWQKTPA